jgi:phosphate starvation-inducible PhoH-like protein
LIRQAIEITPGIEPLYGTHDENLRLLEDGLHVTIDLRSDAIHVTGNADSVARVERVFSDFESLRKAGVNLHNGELHGMLKMVIADQAVTLKSLVDSGRQRSNGVKRMVQPRSPNQRKYVEAIEQSDMVFGLGPAGTGKTYLAVAMAVSALLAKKVSRIILVRPAVEAGERLGFLPGSTMRCMTCSTRRRSTRCWSRTSSRLRRWPLCAGARSTMPSSSWTRRRTPRTSR